MAVKILDEKTRQRQGASDGPLWHLAGSWIDLAATQAVLKDYTDIDDLLQCVPAGETDSDEWKWCHEENRGALPFSPDFRLIVSKAFQEGAVSSETLRAKLQDREAMRRLRLEVDGLTARVRRLEEGVPVLVPIQSFAPEPYELKKTVSVLVRPVGDSYVASFVDANINASGETISGAVNDLKLLLLDHYDHLMNSPESKLGPRMKRMRAVLRQCIAREPNA